MNKETQREKGLATVAVVITISIAALVAGGVYSVNKLNKLEAENQQLKEAVTSEQEEESEATSSDSQGADNENSEPAEKNNEEEDTRVVYAPTPAPSVNTQAEINSGVETSLTTQVEEEGSNDADNEEESVETEETEPEAGFNAIYTTQQIVSENASSTGDFEISVSVSAQGSDVYIPMTTNDSVAADSSSLSSLATRDSIEDNLIGFSYEIDGDEFRGTQTSEVSCPLKQDDRCKIKAGRTSNVEVIVTLTPEESGNYSVEFDKITYIQNGEVKTHSLNEETGMLYLR